MVIERAKATKLAAATGAVNISCFHITVQEFGGLLCAVDAQEVGAAVALACALKFAAAQRAANALCLLLLCVARLHMRLERLGVNKLLAARFALELHCLLVRFHMVVHS